MKHLFRKLTILELVIILFFIIGVSLFAFLFFRRSEYKIVIVKVGSNSIYWDGGATKSWFSQFFYPGMKESDGFGRHIAEVLDIRLYNTSKRMQSVYLTVKLKVVYNRSSNQYSFKGKPILIGSTIKMNLDRSLVEGLVVSFEGIDDVRKKKKFILTAELIEENPVFLETSGARTYYADLIKKGDEITDSKGNVLVRVLDINVSPAKKYVTTADGRIITQIQPDRISLRYTLEVDAVQIYDRYYIFDDVPLLVGENIPLNTSFVSLFPEIISIQEK